MITSTSRSATISLLRSARRITPVVPTGTHGCSGDGGVAAVRPDDQAGAGRDVDERRRRARSDQHLAGADRRPAHLGEGRHAVERRGVRSVLGQLAARSRPPRDPRRRPVRLVEPATFLGRRALDVGDHDEPPRERGLAVGHGARDVVREQRPIVGSLELDLDVVGRSRRLDRPPSTGLPPNDGMTSAWMSRITSATLAAARDSASPSAKPPRWNAMRRWPCGVTNATRMLASPAHRSSS